MTWPRSLVIGLALAGCTPAPVPRKVSGDLAEPLLFAQLPGERLFVTATSGPGEPGSIGSYALRLYAPFDTAWPFDNYVSGAVRPRVGGLDTLRLDDLDGDGMPDVTVVFRSAGPEASIGADAFLVVRQRLVFAARVDSLPTDADPVAALRGAFRTPR